MNHLDSEAYAVRPADASIGALRTCLKWLDACKELGWKDTDLPKLESLWWTYHDKDGNKKPYDRKNISLQNQ